MSNSTEFPYVTLLDVLHRPLELIDEKALADGCPHKWYNQTLCEVNDSVVRLGVVEGEYHWHNHENDDEFFYIVEGKTSSTWRAARLSWRHARGRNSERHDAPPTSPQANGCAAMVETRSIVPTGS